MSDETLREALEALAKELDTDYGTKFPSPRSASVALTEILAAHPAPHPGTVEGRAMGVGCRTCGQAWGWRWALSDMRKGQHYYRNAKGKAFPCDGAPEPIYFAALASSGDALREAAYYWRDWCETRTIENIPDTAERRLAETIDADRRHPAPPLQPAPDPKETYVCRGCGRILDGSESLAYQDGTPGTILKHLVGSGTASAWCGPVEPEARP